MSKRPKDEAADDSLPHSATGLAGSKFNERERQGYVQGPADLPYGEIDGFRYGFTQTGHRHKESDLGRKVRGD